MNDKIFNHSEFYGKKIHFLKSKGRFIKGSTYEAIKFHNAYFKYISIPLFMLIIFCIYFLGFIAPQHLPTFFMMISKAIMASCSLAFAFSVVTDRYEICIVKIIDNWMRKLINSNQIIITSGKDQ